MKRVEIIVAYDGTHYCGWQLQPNGITIEQVLNEALSALLREPIEVIGASRTDAGVHSMGTPAVFDTETRIPAEKIAFALNERLPEDVKIRSSREVPLYFHPRKQNSVKTYEYRIYNHRMPSPIHRLYSYHVYGDLDLARMQEAADQLVGEYDFQSFCSSKTQVQDTVRTIYELNVRREGDEIILRVRGNGFLYNMVRIIAGTLIRVGMGAMTPEEVRRILLARDRSLAGPKAPAHGLMMLEYRYLEEIPAVEKIENPFWAYETDLSGVKENGTAVIRILRCDDEEREELIKRLTLRMIRNDAKTIRLIPDVLLEGKLSFGDFDYRPEEGDPFCGQARSYVTTEAEYRAKKPGN